MKRVAIPDEPCTIAWDVIADVLDRIGWQSAAEFVRDHGDSDAHTGRQMSQLRREYDALLIRLHKYEPPAAEPARVSAKPDWTCDG